MMKNIVAVPGIGRAMPRPLRNACEGLRRDGQPVPPRPGGARAKPRILILGTPDDSRRIIIALRRAGHCPLWKRVDTGGSLTAALSDTSWSWNIVICNAALPSCHFMSAWPIVEALAPRATFVALWDGVGARPAVGHQQDRLIVGRDVDDLPEFVSRIMAARRQRADSDRRPLRADVHRPHYHH